MRERRLLGPHAGRSPERLLPPRATHVYGHRLVPGRLRMLDRALQIEPDVLRNMRVRGERDRDAAPLTSLEQLSIRIHLADRLPQPRRRDLDADAGRVDRVCGLLVQPLHLLRVGPCPMVLDQVGMRERVEQAAPRGVPQPDEVPPPGLVRWQLFLDPGERVDAKAVDEVDRAQQVIERVPAEQLRHLGLVSRHVVDLEPELHGQPALLRGDDGPHVRVEVVHATLHLGRFRPELPRLCEVVDVLGEADLVDPAVAGSVHEPLDRLDGVVDPFVAIAEMHVVVDDHSSGAGSSHPSTTCRSCSSVTFSKRGSPGTTLTRPPRASTSAEQSVAPESSPLSASRSTGARNACGVCTATSSSRSSVSTTASARTRLIVSASGSAGTAPSQPSPSAVRTRSTTSSTSTGRAASCTRITSVSPGTSATPARTDSARVSPPVTEAETLPQPFSSATRIEGSSHSGGATITIASTHSEESNRRSGSASKGSPRSGANALGRSEPRRSPRPAATRTAQQDTIYAVAATFVFFFEPTSERTSSSHSAASSSSMSFAYISSLARIFLALTNICFSPVESPFSRSRNERFRTTSASSRMSPVFILSRLCLKRRFQFLGICVPPPVNALTTTLTMSSPITFRSPTFSAFSDGTFTVMSLCRILIVRYSRFSPNTSRFSFFTTVPAPWCGYTTLSPTLYKPAPFRPYVTAKPAGSFRPPRWTSLPKGAGNGHFFLKIPAKRRIRR